MAWLLRRNALLLVDATSARRGADAARRAGDDHDNIANEKIFGRVLFRYLCFFPLFLFIAITSVFYQTLTKIELERHLKKTAKKDIASRAKK